MSEDSAARRHNQPDSGAGSRAQMPPWIPRLILLLVLSLFGVLALLYVLPRVRDLLVWLLIALFVSFAIEPAVNWLAKHGWRRGVATFAVLFGLFVLGVVMVASMVPLIVEQVQQLIARLPGWLDRLSTYTERWFEIDISTNRILEQLQSADSSLRDFAQNIAGNLLGFGVRVVGAIFQLLTIGLFTFYLVADGPRVRRAICSLFRPERQREVLWAWEVAVEKTGGYLYSRLLLAAFSGVGTFIILTVLGIPFAVPLAFWMGLVSQFVPVVGTYIAMVVPLLVALLENATAAIFLLVYFVTYQQLENYLLSPRISARTMQLHPAVAFAAAIAGASLLGAIGAFLALPAAAIIQATVSAYLTRHEVLETELTRQEVEESVEPAERNGRQPRPFRRLLARLRRKEDATERPEPDES
ncbi:MAG: AI-2E family transporter [Actinomycetota bacterium]